MGSASLLFLSFALIAVLAFNISRAPLWRQAVLLIADITFLSFFSHDVWAWTPFVAFLGFGYLSVCLMQGGAGRASFLPIVVACITAFVWLKKYSFIPALLLLHHPYVTLGLSYIFFRVLHLIIDARNGGIPERVSLISYLNYTLNFTTLISGPIQRYQDFARYQLARVPLPLDVIAIGNVIQRIVLGFFKVNVLSLALATYQATALHALRPNLSFDNRVIDGIGIVATYPLYLYCNFSGYIDIVIGIARLLRMELPENFDRPFSSVNFMIFWSRWHITLSEWLKTYVYNPLLIASMRQYPNPRVAPFFGVLAIFVTFFLVGVWHGQTSVFVFFGVSQGAGVAAVQLYQVLMTRKLGKKRFKQISDDPVWMALSRGLTFTWFAFSLLWFWSNWTQIGDIAHKLGPVALAAVCLAIFLGATVVLWAWETARSYVLRIRVADQPLVLSRYFRTVWITGCAVIALVTVLILNAPAPDIVYKAF